MGILIGVFIAAIFTDLRYCRIPNIVILAGMFFGLSLSLYYEAYKDVAQSLFCMAAVFICFYPFYLIGGIGAGDIKLFMMTCFYIRNESLFNFILVTMIIAGIFAAVKMAVFKESRERLFYLGRYVRKAVITKSIDLYETDKKDRRKIIRMALPAFASLMLMCAGVY